MKSVVHLHLTMKLLLLLMFKKMKSSENSPQFKMSHRETVVEDERKKNIPTIYLTKTTLRTSLHSYIILKAYMYRVCKSQCFAVVVVFYGKCLARGQCSRISHF